MSTEKAYPIRYWIVLLYTIGVPGLLRFDVSGRTHEYGLFNLQSVSVIALDLICLFLFAAVTITSKEPIFARPVRFGAPLWIALLVVFATSSLLEPGFHLSPHKATDVVLSFYRLGEWVLGFVIFVSLYSRVPAEESFDFASTLAARSCWAWLVLVWLTLPLAPSFVYGSGEEGGTSRLGGHMVHPAALGIMACVCCMHAIILLKGTKQFIAVAVSLVTLTLTYSRAQEVVMLLSLMAYAIFFSKGLGRLLGLLGSGLVALGGLVFAPTLVQYAGRGNGLQNVVTLSDRTMVWDAAIEAIKARPWLGYGFIVGVKGAIKDHWKYAHWLPPHAHNDFLQAVLSGGVIAGLLLLAIYFHIVRSALRLVKNDRRGAFHLFALMQFVVQAFLSPYIAGQFTVPSGLLIFCLVYVTDAASALRTSRSAAFRPAALRKSFVLADQPVQAQ